MIQTEKISENSYQDWADIDAADRMDWLESFLEQHPSKIPQLADSLGLYFLCFEDNEQVTLDFSRISVSDALSQRVLPMCVNEKHYVIMADPFSLTLREWAQPFTDRLALGYPWWVKKQLDELSNAQRTIEQIEKQAYDESNDESLFEISHISISKEKNSVVKLVNATLFDALQSRASDIHFESVQDGLLVKYRIDGVLHYITHSQGNQTAEQIISRIKILGKMDISERRIPQDGRFKAFIQQQAVDFRVSIIPGVHGEDAVLRVLGKSHSKELRLGSLGFDNDTHEAIRRLTHKPHGMVLVTGPTGSGKSTTLYSALSELNTGESKIITIEDPVEYQLDGILQIPVNDKKGLTFSRGLRAILRHDPDIILVGEIRDGETAGIAVQAALTGHIVLSSVHANGVFSVLERFLYMGVEPASLISALNGVVAQRLARKVCPRCVLSQQPTEEESSYWGLRDYDFDKPEWVQGQGCDYCRQSGYFGRIALAEVLIFSERLKEALLAKAPVSQLREIAYTEGFIPLHQIALKCAAMGFTTLQEIKRVVSIG